MFGTQVGNPNQAGKPTDYWRSVVSFGGLSALNGTVIEGATFEAAYGGYGTKNQYPVYAHGPTRSPTVAPGPDR